MYDTKLQLISVIIGVGNPLSALLTGPFLARMGASESVVRRAQGAGWIFLAFAQVAFVFFGIATGLIGFRYAQPTMIVVALFNFLMWYQMRPNKVCIMPLTAPQEKSNE